MFYRNCPTCNALMEYKREREFVRYEKSGSKCKKCRELNRHIPIKESTCEICQKIFKFKSRDINKTCSKKCQYILTRNKNTRIADLTGAVFERLLVLEIYGYEKGRTIWKCLCTCGKTINILTHSLTRKDRKATKSCGCLRTGTTSRVWRGGNKVSGIYFSSTKASAKKRNLEFDITVKDMDELIEKQNGKCALTGWDIKVNETASIDRIDSKIGYLKDNIQWVHKDLNRFKWDFDEKYLYRICYDVLLHKGIINNTCFENYEKLL